MTAHLCREKLNLVVPSRCPRSVFVVRVSEYCIVQVLSTVGMQAKQGNYPLEHVVKVTHFLNSSLNDVMVACLTPCMMSICPVIVSLDMLWVWQKFWEGGELQGCVKK